MIDGHEAHEDVAEGDYPLHALEYHWDDFDPHLLCYDTSEREECEFDLEDVAFAVSKRKVCVGRWVDGGRYVACPKQTPVAKFGQCQECSSKSFLPIQECVFEPECDGIEPTKCNGDERVREFCSREHVLYVAFYDTRMKIGMTSSGRIDKRLIEQGADAYSVLGRCQGRKSAREEEKEMSRRLGIPEWHRQQDLLRNFSRRLDVEGIKGRLEGLRMTLGKSRGIDPGPLRWLEDYPIELPLAGVPELQPSAGEHSGEYIGIKGKWLILEDGGLKALNLSDLPGRFLARHVA